MKKGVQGKKKVYVHQVIEGKWQKVWEKEKLYITDLKKAKNKFYNLWMYPYPSAEGLHAGHAFASTGSDIFGRFMRMKGKNVFQPIGYDSFGLHSENFALKIGVHPREMLLKTTKNYERQLKSLGHGFDWSRTVTVSEPDYYRFTQWLFLQLFKAGLVMQKKAPVNWCPSCKTVIADEQVIAGKCERCKAEVKIKRLKQWFFRITAYADRLLEGHKKIDWSKRVVKAQKDWIGKSEGAEIKFEIQSVSSRTNFFIPVFTTRPDTLYGASFLVLSPESAWVKKLMTKTHKEKLSKYIKECQIKYRTYQDQPKQTKSGVFTGAYGLNPATGKKIPIFVSDYVVSEYGSGAIMGVPAHDQRDFDFAKKFKLPIIKVIKGGDVQKGAYAGKGEIINSADWNGLTYPKNIKKIISDIEKKGWGRRAKQYHLRDWLISRQRYWGPPIPLIFCPVCAQEGRSWFNSEDSKKWVSSFKSMFKKKIIENWKLGVGNSADWSAAGWWPVPEKDLPVKLPYLTDWQPEGKGKGPLANHPEFYKVKCPFCKSPAKRETDVSDTFLDSSWYFLAYPNQGTSEWKKGEIPFNREITKKWLPVDLYFGGAEHSVLHLMYARFITMVLYDLGFLDFDEPFPKFFAHGLMIKDGAKMSKSRGNVVNPDEYISKYGADTLRLYLMFMGPMDGYPDFRDEGIEGMRKFVERVWKIFQSDVSLNKSESRRLTIRLHQTIKKVTEDIENFHYNTAIAQLMIFVNTLENIVNGFQGSSLKDGYDVWREALKTLNLLLAPFAPYLAEEIWQTRFAGEDEIENKGYGEDQKNQKRQKLKSDIQHSYPRFQSIHKEPWPRWNPKLIQEEKVTIVVEVNGKVRSRLILDSDQSKSKEDVVRLGKQDKKVAKWLEGKRIKNEIFVPGKLINFVVY